MNKLLIIGYGYTARSFARRLKGKGWAITGTTRSQKNFADIAADGVTPLLWPGDILPALGEATHLLMSAGPSESGDPLLGELGSNLAQLAPNVSWAGYLSTTGVYGDHAGDWVSEETPLTPSTKRGQLRVEAEQAWRSTGLPLHIFRLAGIYGPGRGPFAKVQSGKARRIIKQGQVFSRTHVDDIARVLEASLAHPNPGAAYNVCDDDPAPPQDVLTYAAELLGVEPPPEVAFETAELSPMARSFYAESKRVTNDKIKQELGIELLYPSYREGLRALLATNA